MSSAGAVSLIADLQYNLRTLERTVSGPNPKAVDLGFIEILFHDLEAIQAQASAPDQIKAVSQLTDTLTQMSERMVDLADRQFLGIGRDVEVPLVRAPSPLQNMASEYQPGTEIRAGLDKLSEHFDVIRIKGDGHCLFRSALVGVSSNHSDEKVSDLRKKVCLINSQAHRKDAVAGIAHGRNYSVKQYLQRMRTMSFREEGGELELSALAQVLNTNIVVMNAAVIGRNDPSQKGSITYEPEHAVEDTIYLLYRPGHYDLLLPASIDID